MLSIFVAFFGGIYIAIRIAREIIMDTKSKKELSEREKAVEDWDKKNVDDELMNDLLQKIDDDKNRDTILEEVRSSLDEIGQRESRLIVLNADHYEDLLTKGIVTKYKNPPRDTIIDGKMTAATILLANRGKVIWWRNFLVGDVYKDKISLDFARWVEKTANKNGADVKLVEDMGWMRWNRFPK